MMIEALKRTADERNDFDGEFTRADYDALVATKSDGYNERLTLMSFIVRNDEKSPGQRLLEVLDFIGTALFAFIGVVHAGQVGMNIVGCTLVGCVASMGGGTLNNVMTNNTRGGVFWMRDPRFLAVALVTSIISFFAWPKVETELARRELFRNLNVDVGADESLTKAQFVEELEDDAVLRGRVANALGLTDDSFTPSQLFDKMVHTKHAERVQVRDLTPVARAMVLGSRPFYAVETMALSAVAVIGAQAGITRAIHPLASITLGVTICSGGILRDLLCRRDVAIGSQSYALASLAGATTYVALRELVVRGIPLQLTHRIAASMAVVLAQRIHAWSTSGPADSYLPHMANYSKAKIT